MCVQTQLSGCGYDCKWYSFGAEMWQRQAWVGSMTVWQLTFQSYLDYLKHRPHKVIFCATDLDGSVRYPPEINKSHPQIVAAFEQG